jgi:hypothetical protein
MHWWQSLLGESLIIALFIAVSAAIAWCIEKSETQREKAPLTINSSKSHKDADESTDATRFPEDHPNNNAAHGEHRIKRFCECFAAWRHCLREHAPSAQTWTNILLVLFTGALAWVAWSQYDFSKTSERAYVVFGSKDGSLAEFGNPIDGKKSIKLHFFNGGQSVARHFGVQVHTCAGGGKFQFTQRHRTKGPFGEIMTQSPSNESDLSAQGERNVYVIDPKELWTAQQLAEPKGCFWITGQMEYCDIFGRYHCESFNTEWQPTIADFVPSEFLQCTREGVDPRSLKGIFMGKAVTYKEIEPCEQPDEPEYERVGVPTP